MPMFWSKKPKAEKNYDKAAAPAKPAPSKGNVAKAKAAAKPVKQAAAYVPSGSFGGAADAILRPHVTEKSGILSQSGVYTFQVSKSATKQSVSKAMSALYKVKPVKIAMVTLPAKKILMRGRIGSVAGMRKAVVTLKKGEKIDFV